MEVVEAMRTNDRDLRKPHGEGRKGENRTRGPPTFLGQYVLTLSACNPYKNSKVPSYWENVLLLSFPCVRKA